MLPARPNALVQAWFDGWCRRALRQHFRNLHLYLESPDDWNAFDPNLPRLYVANHSSFWDGIVFNELLRRHRRQPGFIMIDEVQVRKHPFFRRVGGFSVDRSRPRQALQAVRYAAGLLNGTNPALPPAKTGKGRAAVVLFPQGKILPNDLRPLAFEAGVGRLIEMASEVRVVPVALRYEFWIDQRAQAMLWLGRERSMAGLSRPRIVGELEEAVTVGLKHLTSHGLNYRPGDRLLLQGRPSITEWKGALRRP